MGQITFIAPDGEERLDPSREFLKELILKRGDEYWQSGSGDAALWFDYDEERRARLILIENEPEGFFLLYESPDEGMYYCPTNEAELEQTITVYVGGEEMEVSVGHFLNKQVAWLAVEDFLQSGERSAKLKWEVWQ